MKKTIMPTKLEYIRFIYLTGILKIILFTAMFTVLAFIGLAAALFYTGFDERLAGDSVLAATGICFLIGIIAGTYFHRKSLLKSSYCIKTNKIKLYLFCNCMYSVILYLLFMMII